MPQSAEANGYRGINIPEDDIPQTITYVTVGSNTFVDTITISYVGYLLSDPFTPIDNVTYIQQFENNGVQITNVPVWTPQA